MRRLKSIFVITSLAGFAMGIYLAHKKGCSCNSEDMTVFEENFSPDDMDSLKEKLQKLLTKLNTKKIKKTTVSLLKNIENKLTEIIDSMSN